MSNMLAAVGSFLSSTLDINQATLSGALDVIAVRYDDGSIKSTPFHVRIGKLKLLRSTNKTIKVIVNGEETGLTMKLGSAGEAYFLSTSELSAADAPHVEQDRSVSVRSGSADLEYSRRGSLSESTVSDPAHLSELPSLEIDGTVTLRGVPVGQVSGWNRRLSEQLPSQHSEAKNGSLVDTVASKPTNHERNAPQFADSQHNPRPGHRHRHGRGRNIGKDGDFSSSESERGVLSDSALHEYRIAAHPMSIAPRRFQPTAPIRSLDNKLVFSKFSSARNSHVASAAVVCSPAIVQRARVASAFATTMQPPSLHLLTGSDNSDILHPLRRAAALGSSRLETGSSSTMLADYFATARGDGALESLVGSTDTPVNGTTPHLPGLAPSRADQSSSFQSARSTDFIESAETDVNGSPASIPFSALAQSRPAIPVLVPRQDVNGSSATVARVQEFPMVANKQQRRFSHADASFTKPSSQRKSKTRNLRRRRRRVALAADVSVCALADIAPVLAVPCEVMPISSAENGLVTFQATVPSVLNSVALPVISSPKPKRKGRGRTGLVSGMLSFLNASKSYRQDNSDDSSLSDQDTPRSQKHHISASKLTDILAPVVLPLPLTSAKPIVAAMAVSAAVKGGGNLSHRQLARAQYLQTFARAVTDTNSGVLQLVGNTPSSPAQRSVAPWHTSWLLAKNSFSIASLTMAVVPLSAPSSSGSVPAMSSSSAQTLLTTSAPPSTAYGWLRAIGIGRSHAATSVIVAAGSVSMPSTERVDDATLTEAALVETLPAFENAKGRHLTLQQAGGLSGAVQRSNWFASRAMLSPSLTLPSSAVHRQTFTYSSMMPCHVMRSYSEPPRLTRALLFHIVNDFPSLKDESVLLGPGVISSNRLKNVSAAPIMFDGVSFAQTDVERTVPDRTHRCTATSESWSVCIQRALTSSDGGTLRRNSRAFQRRGSIGIDAPLSYLSPNLESGTADIARRNRNAASSFLPDYLAPALARKGPLLYAASATAASNLVAPVDTSKTSPSSKVCGIESSGIRHILANPAFGKEGLDAAAKLGAQGTLFADALHSSVAVSLSSFQGTTSTRVRRSRSLGARVFRQDYADACSKKVMFSGLTAERERRFNSVVRAALQVVESTMLLRMASVRALSFDASALSALSRSACYDALRLWYEAGAVRIPSAGSIVEVAAAVHATSLSGTTSAAASVMPLSRSQRFLGWIPVVGSLLAPSQAHVGAAAPATDGTAPLLLRGGEIKGADSLLPVLPAAPLHGRRRASTAGSFKGRPDDSFDAGSVLSGDQEDRGDTPTLNIAGAGGYETDASHSTAATRPPLARGASTAAAIKRSLVPTDAQLRSLHLRAGSNTLDFELASDKSVRVSSTLYLWTPHTKIVVSDVDGTITKSDALGHLYYMIGRDWTHEGVAQLFHNIEDHGYSVMYLTSRAIGQSEATKEYLHHIAQGAVDECGKATAASGASASAHRKPVVAATAPPLNRKSQPPVPPSASPGAASAVTATVAGVSVAVADVPAAPGPLQPVKFRLPLGPVFTSPDRLLTAFTREVIHRRPQEFKIPSLVNVLQLFPPGSHPFYAGFGNRNTDVEAYLAVGIPPSKIFVINPAGEVRLSSAETHAPKATAAVTTGSSVAGTSAASPVHASKSPPRPMGSESPLRSPLLGGTPHMQPLLPPPALQQAKQQGPSQTYCKSYPFINSLVSEMFPFISSEATGGNARVGAHLGLPVALNERYNDVNYWRRPMCVLDPSDLAASSAGSVGSKISAVRQGVQRIGSEKLASVTTMPAIAKVSIK